MTTPRRSPQRKDRAGFTLIELIVVIAIITGIAGVILVTLNPEARIEQAVDTQTKQNAEQMTKALMLSVVDNFAIPAGIPDNATKDICKQGQLDPSCVNLDELVTDGYLASIPMVGGSVFSGYEVVRKGGYVEICPEDHCQIGGGGGPGGGDPGGGDTIGGGTTGGDTTGGGTTGSTGGATGTTGGDTGGESGGESSSSPPLMEGPFVIAQGADWVSVADVDVNGTPDVLWNRNTTPPAAWHKNTDGLGSFDGGSSFTSSLSSHRSIAAFNLDADSALEVLVADGVNTIAWFDDTDSNGIFNEPHQVVTTQAVGAQQAIAADLDQDGDLEVIVASRGTAPSYANGEIAWYDNEDGADTFGPEQVLATVVQAYAVTAADMDNDNDQDILAAVYGVSGSNHEIIWFENRINLGEGFGAKQVIVQGSDAGLMPTSVVAADFNNDGFMDVAFSSLLTRWVPRNPDGTWAPPLQIWGGAKQVVAVDLDNDGHTDVLSAGFSSLLWIRNGGFNNNYFEPPLSIDPNSGTYESLDTHDADCDGDMDVFAVKSTAVEWYRNTLYPTGDGCL